MSELNKVFKVIVIVWLSVLTLVWLVIVVRWQDVCDRIAMTVVEGMVGGGRREVTYYQPDPPQLVVRDDRLEDLKADLERVAPSETLDEALERIGREQRELEAYLFKDQDPNGE